MPNLLALVCFTFGAFVLASCNPPAPHDDPESVHADQHADASEEDAHAGEVHVDPEVAEQQGIRVSVAELRALTPTLTTPARVALSQEHYARAASPVSGRILEFSTAIGAEVAVGDPLAVLHSPEFATAQRELVRGAQILAALRPQEALARAAWQRASELNARQGDPPLVEVQRREAELRRSEAELLSAEGSLQQQRDVLALWSMTPEEIEALLAGNAPRDHYVLRAPISGRVIERNATVGEMAGPEDGPLATIADLNQLWVLANYPESRLRQLRLGASARVLLESEPGHGCPGRVVFISPVLDLTNRTVEVRIQPDDEHEDLRPGLFARAEIELAPAAGTPLHGVAVPESAVARLDGIEVVFVPVEGEPGVFMPRSIRTGRTVGGWIPVLDGLAEGESFVSEGAFLLKAESEKAEGGHDH